MTTLQGAINELKRELIMRRKVWRRVPGSLDQFLDQSHQNSYSAMVDVLAVLEQIGPKGWNDACVAIERKALDQQAQTSLF